jgi:hypothetical protein
MKPASPAAGPIRFSSEVLPALPGGKFCLEGKCGPAAKCAPWWARARERTAGISFATEIQCPEAEAQERP